MRSTSRPKRRRSTDASYPRFPADRAQIPLSFAHGAQHKGDVAAVPPDLAGRIAARTFDNLPIDFAHEQGAEVIVRGLRAVSDFEREFQTAGMNAGFDPEVETVFPAAGERERFIASQPVKEIGRRGGGVSTFVSPRVRARFATVSADDKIQPLKPSG